MPNMLMLLQSADVRIEGAIPIWALVVAICGAAFTLGGIAMRVYMHSRYHRDHYKHSNDRDMHPDPRINDGNMKLLQESQLRINNALEKHLESDIKANDRVDGLIEGFRKENRENADKLNQTLEGFRKQTAEQNKQIINVLAELANRR